MTTFSMLPANAASSSYSWPTSLASAAPIITHGDGSFTIADARCSGYSSTSPVYINYTAGVSEDTSIPYEANGWRTVLNCGALWNSLLEFTAGSDKTIYFVQEKIASPHSQRLIAVRGTATLWVKEFGAICGSYYPLVFNPTMDFDGNILVEVKGSGAVCANHLFMVKLNASTGEEIFTTELPSTTSPNMNNGFSDDEIMPYEGGIAVANGTSIYYYSHAGVIDSLKTFVPPTGNDLRSIRTSSTGRTYMIIAGASIKLYYKDVDDSTVYEVSPISGKEFVAPLNVTPDNGVVVRMLDSSAHNYFGYFDQYGSEVYEKNLYSDSLGYSPGGTPSILVDDLGNVLVTRLEYLNASPNDQTVYVDSFDQSGNLTRLFDAVAEYGSAGRDVFTGTGGTTQSFGDGKLHIALCHQTSGSAKSCPSYITPSLVTVVGAGTHTYPSSEVFASEEQRLNYVALGDSYSSGEGNPPFVVPTDNNGGNGCDRSLSTAYPVILAKQDTALNLRAFVACSGATTVGIFSGINGEPGQLESLDAKTDIVTLTAGGNDALFEDFAVECVLGTCDAGSSEYLDTMDEVDNYLQDNLELLYGRIRTAASDATIYVLGYPYIADSSDGSCPVYISSGEEVAIDSVITSINNKIEAAINSMDADFVYVEPNDPYSPFEFHSLCSGDPFFFGTNIAEHRFSFHPNPDGQEAYAELIASAMS